jgi:integrase/recombinase XerD
MSRIEGEKTLATVATEFLSRPDLAPATVKSYELVLLPLLKQQGRSPIQTLTRQSLEQYFLNLDHLAYTTHRRHQAIIQSLLNFAVEQGYVSHNPIQFLKPRKPNRDKGEHYTDETVRYLTPEQIQILYGAIAPHTRLNAVVRLLHRTGARISELLSLDLADVDRIQCRFQVVGKGNRQRWCFYSPDAADALESYVGGDRQTPHTALFTARHPVTNRVTRLSYATVHHDWKTVIQEYPELQNCRLHDLRHTFATERVGLMGIEELRALLGHQTLQTTLRYQKVTSQRAELIARKALSNLMD